MKKIFAVMLAGIMAATMGLTSFAATVEYESMVKPLGYSYKGSTSGDTLDLGEINADGDEIEFPLSSEMFEVPSGDTQPPNGTPLSSADIRKSKIAVRIQNAQGSSKILKSFSVVGKDSVVKLEFADEWVSTEEKDFEMLVYLTLDGTRFDDEGITITGTMLNPVIEVDSDMDSVDLSDGYVAEAMDFVDNIEVDLGNGVTMHTKFFKGKKYYGTASREPDEADDIVMKQYPDIDNVVKLTVIGLNSTGDVVRLDTDYSNYYVYDKDLNYLGQSNEMLPYSATYYLANKQLDVEGEEEPEEPEEPEDEPGLNPDGGGDGASNNANANPGTGR